MAKAKKKATLAKNKTTPAKKVLAKPTKKSAPQKSAKAAAKKPTSKLAKKTPQKAPQTKVAKPAMKAPKTQSVTGKKPDSFYQKYLRPLDNRIVVLVTEMAKVTPGGLYIPDTATDTSGNYHGKVVAVGRGHMSKKGKVKPMDVSVGDKVVFSQFSGSRIELEGSDILIIRESDVLGIEK